MALKVKKSGIWCRQVASIPISLGGSISLQVYKSPRREQQGVQLPVSFGCVLGVLLTIFSLARTETVIVTHPNSYQLNGILWIGR